MTPYIEKALRDRPTGLSLHYPFLHAAVVGMGARRTLEFGAGGSTRVFLGALPDDGRHVSISMETREGILERYILIDARSQADRARVPPPDESSRFVTPWDHHEGKSDTFRSIDPGPLDLILHDGSHAANVVAADIAWAWPYLKRFGLLLVHDSLHSYCGAEVREGIRRGLAGFPGEYTATTLPYGFGLTIIRREVGGPGVVEPAQAKAGSEHGTENVEFRA